MRAPFACRSRAFSAACTASLRACRIVHTVFALVPCAISLKNALDPFHCAYSTVTDFARFLGLSMSVPRARCGKRAVEARPHAAEAKAALHVQACGSRVSRYRCQSASLVQRAHTVDRRARALHADWISVFQAAHHSAQSQQPAWRLSQARAVRV